MSFSRRKSARRPSPINLTKTQLLIQRFHDFIDLLENETAKAIKPPLFLSENSEIVGFILLTLIEMLLDGFCRTASWLQIIYYCSFFGNENVSLFGLFKRVCKSPTTQFISDRFNYSSEEDQLRHWLLLLMNSNTLYSTFKTLSLNRAVLSRYRSNSLIKKQSQSFLQELKRIDELSFKLSAEAVQGYLEYQNEINCVNQFIAKAGSFQYLSVTSSRQSKTKKNTSDKFVPSVKNDIKSLDADWTSGNIRLDEIRSNILYLKRQNQEGEDDVAFNTLLQSSMMQKKDHQLNPHSSKSEDTKENSVSSVTKTNEEEYKETEAAEAKKASLETIYGGESSSNESESHRMPLLPLRRVEDVMNSQLKSGEESLVSVPKSKRMKNSQVLYKEKFKKYLGMFEYREEPPANRTAKEQGYKCFSCGKPLRRALLLFNSRMGYCHYTGRWYCMACFGHEKSILPWKVKNKFEFKRYSVCKDALEEISRKSNKCNIIIDPKSEIVKKNQILYDTLTKRMELHLIFDMICNTSIVLDLLPKRANLLLKENLFSLKNMEQINDGTLFNYLEHCVSLLSKHIQSCKKCQKRGHKCKICNSTQKIFAFDIQHTSFCRQCHGFYHLRCLELKSCVVCSPENLLTPSIISRSKRLTFVDPS